MKGKYKAALVCTLNGRPQNAGAMAGGITEYLDHGSPSDAVALAAVAGRAACVADAVHSGDCL